MSTEHSNPPVFCCDSLDDLTVPDISQTDHEDGQTVLDSTAEDGVGEMQVLVRPVLGTILPGL